MEQPETLSENVKDYVQTRIDLIKLKTVDKASTAITSTIVSIATAILGLFIILFLSFAAAYGVAELTGKTYIGFLVVSGFYMLLLFFIHVFKEKLITVPLINVMLDKFYWKEEDRKEEEKQKREE
jgi:ABC-type glycerol-3-phosphate transport system permease component